MRRKAGWQYCAVNASSPALVCRPGPPPAPRHAREWALALALALAGHALVLATAPLEPGQSRLAQPASSAPAPRAAAALVVRRIDAAVASPAPVGAPGVAPAVEPVVAPAANSPARSSAQAPALAAASPPVAPAHPPILATPVTPSTPATAAAEILPTPATRSPDPVAQADDPEEGAPAVAYAGRAPPVLPTRIAPAFVQGYTMRRGAQAGRAELRLERGAEQYRLSLRGRVEGGRLLEQTSQGGFDAAGVAPERFVDRRRGRAAQAANFDRAAGRITYSGPSVEQPLHAGAQDRLSWIVQLAAVIQADPGRWTPGERLPLYVTGARGDAQLWLFEVRERADLDLPGVQVAHALRLTREPQRPYDSRVEVWLDPARHHLPALLRFTQVPQGGTLELQRDP